MRADIRATTDEPTPVSIWSHPYLNLAGVYSNDTSILDHVFTVNSSYYMATNPSGAATGAFEPVAGTPLDFTTPHTIGERINGTQWWRGTVWGGSGGVGWGWSIPNLLLSRMRLQRRMAATRWPTCWGDWTLPPPPKPPASRLPRSEPWAVESLEGGIHPVCIQYMCAGGMVLLANLSPHRLPCNCAGLSWQPRCCTQPLAAAWKSSPLRQRSCCSQVRGGWARVSWVALATSIAAVLPATGHQVAPLQRCLAGNFKPKDEFKFGLRPTNKHAAMALEAVRRGGGEGVGGKTCQHCLARLPPFNPSLPRLPGFQTMFSEGVVQPGFPDLILRPGEEYRNQVGRGLSMPWWEVCAVGQSTCTATSSPHPKTPRELALQVVWRFFQEAPSAAGGLEPATSAAARRALVWW